MLFADSVCCQSANESSERRVTVNAFLNSMHLHGRQYYSEKAPCSTLL